MITATNLITMGFSEILSGLSDMYVKDIEKPSQDAKSLDALAEDLRKLTNHYAYLTELYNYACHYTRNAPKEVKSDFIDKRDALERIMKSIDIKIKTTSRLVTVFELKAKELLATKDGHEHRSSQHGWGAPK